MYTMQEAATSKGIAEVCRTYSDDEELKVHRVSSIWLKTFLTPEELDAVARLSVFQGSFSAAGAAAVLHGLRVPQEM